MHHDFNRNHKIQMGSNRSFGLLLSGVIGFYGLFLFVSKGFVSVNLLVVAAFLFLVALVFPRVLGPFNKVWFHFGRLLEKFVSPLAIAILYVVTVIPVGFVMRALGKDLLGLRSNPEQDSYWIERKEQPGSMKNQF